MPSEDLTASLAASVHGRVVRCVKVTARDRFARALFAVPLADPLTDDECAEAMRALSVPVSSHRRGPVSTARDFAVLFLSRNEREVPDPDAGSIVQADVSVALWDLSAHAWRWETTRCPGFVLEYLIGYGDLALSWDERGIFARVPRQPTESTVYDVATGALRPARATDSPPVLPPPRGLVIAADRARRWMVAARGSAINLWDAHANAHVDTIDFASVEDTPTSASFVDDGGSFVVATERGRLFEFRSNAASS